MEKTKIITLTILSTVILLACQNPQTKQKEKRENVETRPKEQLNFLNKIAKEYGLGYNVDALKKDRHIAALNKYALDSLKKVSNWEMIVAEIDDKRYNANSVAKNTFDLLNSPVYNLILVAPIKQDLSSDTVGLDNRVTFTYTLLKSPKNQALKKQLGIIKALTKGDKVLVSGAITHLDEKLKVNFASFYESIPYVNWNFDVLITDIRKKR